MLMFKNFQISILFDWQNGNTDLKKEHINGKGIPVVSSGVENTGIIGRTDVDARILPAHTITVDMFGNVYYRDFEYKEVTHARVFTLIPKGFKLDIQTGLYFVSSLKVLSKIYSYDNMCSYAKISNMDILLPVIENSNPDHEYTVDDIDWQYMRDRITELERDRITELERDRITELDAYLQATGLNDYELTDEDIETLSLSGFGHYEERDSEDAVKICKEMREFRCGDLFDIHPTKAYKMSNDELYQTSGNSPVLSNSSVDNGIGGYCGLDTTENGRIITFSDTTTGTDTMFYQPNSFIGYAHVQGMYPFDENWGEFQQRYFICAMKQACGTGWDYSNKFNRKLVAEMTPLLPIQTDTEGNSIIDTECKYHPDGYIPDWNFMEKYIRAIEKIVIADVVQYKDTMISKTKEVVA